LKILWIISRWSLAAAAPAARSALADSTRPKIFGWATRVKPFRNRNRANPLRG
jgi:hypothetical protein